MEYEIELSKFSGRKEIHQATCEFKDYARDWWRGYTPKNFVRTWQDLKKMMRKEFVPKEYQQILVHRVKNMKQGSSSVQAFYDKLFSSMYRANITNDIEVMSYFERGLNAILLLLQKGRNLQELVIY